MVFRHVTLMSYLRLGLRSFVWRYDTPFGSCEYTHLQSTNQQRAFQIWDTFAIDQSATSLLNLRHICNRPISDEPSESWNAKTTHILWAVVQLINIYLLSLYYWTIEDEWRPWPHMKCVYMLVYCYKKINRRDITEILLKVALNTINQPNSHSSNYN